MTDPSAPITGPAAAAPGFDDRSAFGLVDLPTRPIPRRGERRRRRLQLSLTFIASLLLINAIVGDRGLLETWRARRDYAALSGGITQLRDENRTLRDEARRLREDPKEIEAVARQDLGLIRPGEVLVVVRPVR
jgi:cell division protein FtsB